MCSTASLFSGCTVHRVLAATAIPRLTFAEVQVQCPASDSKQQQRASDVDGKVHRVVTPRVQSSEPIVGRK